MSLTFNAKNHQYRLHGKHIPGVTTLIGDGLPKPALVRWAAKSVAEFVADNAERVEALRGMPRESVVAALSQVPWSERDTAAVRGSDVHALAERLAHGDEVEVPDHLAGYVEAYVDFLDTWRIKPVLTERPVYNEQWWYAGTFDMVAELPEDLAAMCPQLGPRPLLDVKTSKGVYGETALQLAGYRFAERWVDADGNDHPMSDLGITGAGVIHVRADGWDLVPMVADESVFKTFLYVARVARSAKTMRELKGEPMGRPTSETSAA